MKAGEQTVNDNLDLVRSALSGMAWPMVPTDAGALALAVQFQLEQTQWWPPDELERHQMQQLQLLLRHAHDTLPFWRERFQKAGFDPDREVTPELFRSLPLMTRADVQVHGEALLSRQVPRDHGAVAKGETSGSTGRPITYYGTGLTQFFWRAYTLRDHLWHQRDFSGKLAAIRTKIEDKVVQGWGPATDSVFATGPCAMLNIRADIDAQLEWLRQQAPQYLISHPHNLRELARKSIALRVSLPGLREVRSFGAVLPADLRAASRQAWDVPVTDLYSAEEVGYIALQCPQHEHYHAQFENVIVEVLDSAGTPCAPGEVGRVVLTTLHNFAMPLVRYAIGDYAEAGESCDCGRGLPVIKRIMGRDRNMLTKPDGSQHWPSFPAEIWTAVAPIRQFRLIQKSLDRIEAQFAAANDLGREQRDRLTGSLQKSLGYPFNIELVRVDEMSGSVNFKFEDFISEIRR